MWYLQRPPGVGGSRDSWCRGPVMAGVRAEGRQVVVRRALY